MSAGAATPATSAPAPFMMPRRVMLFIFIRSPCSTAGIFRVAASLTGLDSRPQPIDQPLCLLIVRNDRIELRHSRRIWIHGSVVQNGFIDHIARGITVGIGYVIR